MNALHPSLNNRLTHPLNNRLTHPLNNRLTHPLNNRLIRNRVRILHHRQTRYKQDKYICSFKKRKDAKKKKKSSITGCDQSPVSYHTPPAAYHTPQISKPYFVYFLRHSYSRHKRAQVRGFGEASEAQRP
jgi:hypothetical protein